MCMCDESCPAVVYHPSELGHYPIHGLPRRLSLNHTVSGGVVKDQRCIEVVLRERRTERYIERDRERDRERKIESYGKGRERICVRVLRMLHVYV